MDRIAFSFPTFAPTVLRNQLMLLEPRPVSNQRTWQSLGKSTHHTETRKGWMNMGQKHRYSNQTSSLDVQSPSHLIPSSLATKSQNLFRYFRPPKGSKFWEPWQLCDLFFLLEPWTSKFFGRLSPQRRTRPLAPGVIATNVWLNIFEKMYWVALDVILTQMMVRSPQHGLENGWSVQETSTKKLFFLPSDSTTNPGSCLTTGGYSRRCPGRSTSKRPWKWW